MNRLLLSLLIGFIAFQPTLTFAAGDQPENKPPVAFGNARWTEVSLEFAGIENRFGATTGRVMGDLGRAAMILAAKGVDFKFQGHTSDKWYSSSVILEVQTKKSVRGSILAKTDVADIRLSPEGYYFWFMALKHAQEVWRSRDRRDLPNRKTIEEELTQILTDWSPEEREGILFAYLAHTPIHGGNNMAPVVMHEKLAILQAAGLTTHGSYSLVTHIMKDAYPIAGWDRILSRCDVLVGAKDPEFYESDDIKKISEKLGISSRGRNTPPPPLPGH